MPSAMAARRRAAKLVLLNAYDINPANDFTHSSGMGVHHKGVETNIVTNMPIAAQLKTQDRREFGIYTSHPDALTT